MQSNQIDQLIHSQKWSELSDYLQGCSFADDNAPMFYARGMLSAYDSSKNKDLQQAIRYLKKACELDTKNPKYKYILSAFLLDSGQNNDAHKLALDAYTVAPSDPMASITLGKSFLANKKELDAYKSYQNALLNIPDSNKIFKEHIKHTMLKLPIFWNTPLNGRRVSLTRVTEQHFNFVFSLRKNEAFRNQYNFFHKTSEQAVKESIQTSQKPPLESNKIEWIIEREGTPIGIASLVDMNLRNSRAELLIGLPDVSDGWVSLEATLLILEFAFKTLGLAKVYSYVYSDNTQSQKNTLHLGFTQEGVLRSHVIRPDTSETLDLIINGYLANEFFQNPRILKLFTRVLGRSLDSK